MFYPTQLAQHFSSHMPCGPQQEVLRGPLKRAERPTGCFLCVFASFLDYLLVIWVFIAEIHIWIHLHNERTSYDCMFPHGILLGNSKPKAHRTRKAHATNTTECRRASMLLGINITPPMIAANKRAGNGE